MKYSQYLPEFEMQTGKEAGEFLKKFAAAMDTAMEAFEEKGREHAAVGQKPYTKEALMRWALQEVGADLGELVGEEMYDSYMRGYECEAVA